MNQAQQADSVTPGIAWIPLLLALAILISMTVSPKLATDLSGTPDHPVALLLLVAMSAGFVRGVGFIPKHVMPRLLFSSWTTYLFLLLALWRLNGIGRLPVF